jgi:hypothetical protein
MAWLKVCLHWTIFSEQREMRAKVTISTANSLPSDLLKIPDNDFFALIITLQDSGPDVVFLFTSRCHRHLAFSGVCVTPCTPHQGALLRVAPPPTATLPSCPRGDCTLLSLRIVYSSNFLHLFKILQDFKLFSSLSLCFSRPLLFFFPCSSLSN